MFHESGTICYSLFAYSSITELPIDRCTKRAKILLPQSREILQTFVCWGLACVASVSVWFRSKKSSWKGTFGFDRGRNETRTKPSRPTLLLAPFYARRLTLVPYSLLLNRTETLATQARWGQELAPYQTKSLQPFWRIFANWSRQQLKKPYGGRVFWLTKVIYRV